MDDDEPGHVQRPKTLADVGMRFPPPPGTRFYVCFRADMYEPFPPYEEMLNVVADHPDDAIEQLNRDGKIPTGSRFKVADVIWFDHNGHARSRDYQLCPEDGRRERKGFVPMPQSRNKER